MTQNAARACTIEAPCKINLHLVIGGKRPDGFHSLESVFASLALADTLVFGYSGKTGECLLSTAWETAEEPIPPESNLVYKAVSLFREKTGFSRGLSVRLTKRVPSGAGLGGGSSDAASALLALNALAGSRLPADTLAEMASILGSDVPFFLGGGAAFVSGRGEKIERVMPPEGLTVVLVKPPFNSDTSFAYRLIDRARDLEGRKKESVPKEDLIRALGAPPETWPFRNDFLPVFLDSRFSEGENAAAYRTILDALRKYGASFAGLSGSGSSCFGIFTSRDRAEKAAGDLAAPEYSISAPSGEFSENFTGNFERFPQRNLIKVTFFLANGSSPVLNY